MFLIDVNVLVYAHRKDSPTHPSYYSWLEQLVNSHEAFGMADLVFSGFLRVVTHPRVFRNPSKLEDALGFVSEIRGCSNCVTISPGDRHWGIFEGLCRNSGAKGNLIPDAYLAALAIESGSEWITTDRGYGRFPGLRWRHPLE